MGLRTIIGSHTLIFCAGFAAGKLYDRDELNTYRESHERPMTKLRRYAGNALIGAFVLGGLVLVSKIGDGGSTTSASSSSSSSNGGKSSIEKSGAAPTLVV
mmetsp:Transcript_22917/g.54349  ORF Transcript_22917/g.54349 Transcript_22917/m.54349 type:complete len:101 (+) Transcript_22917:112-414(+)